MMRYYSVKPRVGYIGTAQVEYRWGHEREAYFVAVKQAWEDWNKIIARTWNPQDRLMQKLCEVSGQVARIAEEPGPRPNFSLASSAKPPTALVAMSTTRRSTRPTTPSPQSTASSVGIYLLNRRAEGRCDHRP